MNLRLLIDVALISALILAIWKREAIMWSVVSALAFVLVIMSFFHHQWIMVVLNSLTTVFAALNARMTKGKE